MNNAVTRWIGYEWKEQKVYNKSKTPNVRNFNKTKHQVFTNKKHRGLRGANDLKVNNLIKNQYVLRHKPGNTTVNERRKHKFGDRQYISYRKGVTSKRTGFDGLKASIKEMSNNKNDIHFYNAIEYLMKVDYVLPFSSLHSDDTISSKGIWNKLLKDICVYLGLNQNKYFQKWEHEGDRTKYRKSLMSYLSDKDIDTLHEYNYFDFKLYQLAKYISEADLIFDGYLKSTSR